MTNSRRIAVIGAGGMGTAIATLCAAHGYSVALTDINAALLNSYPDRALPIAQYLAGTTRSAEDILKNVERVPDLGNCVKDAFLVEETIHEDLPAKRALFQQLDTLCGPDILLATNTSSFLLSEICGELPSRSRVVGIHYVAPAHLVRAVEVLTADFTDAKAIEQAKAFVDSIDHISIVCREAPGFIINRLQYALRAEAMRMIEQGVASVEDIDAAVRLAMGPRLALWGPLMQEDMSATKKTVLSVNDYIYNATGNAHFKPPQVLKDLVAAGNLGANSGAGWYQWNIEPTRLTAERDRQLGELLTWLRAHDRRDALGAKGENPLIRKRD